MSNATPWMTSNQLIESVKRKISMPLSQNTFMPSDILAFANEEMAIAQVPSMIEFHQEYFVYKVDVPLQNNVSRYSIPDRAIGMKLRDLFYTDDQGNLLELTRVAPEDKAYWQSSVGTMSTIHKFYLEGNEVVLTPDFTSGANGSLSFYIFLRPNQLVADERACVSQYFTRTITMSSVLSGDIVTLDGVDFTATSLAPTGNQFLIGLSDAETATNLTTAINAASLNINASNGSPATAVVLLRYLILSTEFTSSNTTRLAIQTTQGIEFNQVPSTYLDPETNLTSTLYVDGSQIDFLQTKPGHRTYYYDVSIPMNAISGNIISFNSDTVPAKFLIGDYICLSNECIIPQIPPDLHNGLAERTSARILAAIGDQTGLQAAMVKIQDIENRQGPLLMNRVEGAPQKISGRHGMLRYNKRGFSWRF